MTSTKLAATGLMVNEIILDLLGKVLALSDYRGIICEMYPFDVELLLDLISYVCALLFPLFVYYSLSAGIPQWESLKFRYSRWKQ